MQRHRPSKILPYLLQQRSTAVSLAGHAVLLAALFGVWQHASFTAPYKLPGTALGVRSLTYYSPGSKAPSASQSVLKDVVPAPVPALSHRVAAARPDVPSAVAAERGTGSTAESGRGDGQISIALGKVFPHPKPDLSSMARGAGGDVILDAVIDEQGAIQQLTLVQGLGPAIDDVVIATVKTWSYTPAMRNGVPVSSEQELLFHYERG